jgi:hypothetical protein
MYDALIPLYQCVNISLKMLLKNKLIATQMNYTNIVATYLIKIIELGDQCATTKVKVEDKELVSIH